MSGPGELREARAVVRSLELADRELTAVRANTSDPQVDASAELAQKSTRTALRRAKLISKDIDLRHAEQQALGLGGEGTTDAI